MKPLTIAVHRELVEVVRKRLQKAANSIVLAHIRHAGPRMFFITRVMLAVEADLDRRFDR
jgi:hypothetical protein